MSRENGVDRRTVLKATGMSALSAGLVSMAGCIEGDDDDEDLVEELPDEITITLSQFPDTQDPLDHITGDFFDVYDHIYEPMLDFQPGEGFNEWVIEDWDFGDGVTEITIRDDVVFHNGDDLTAEDVAFTINRTIDPDVGVPSPIGTFGLGSITGAEATGEHTLEISHSASAQLAQFEWGNYARAMNREWTVENYNADQPGVAVAGDDPEDFNGTGPYEVVEFTSGEEIVLERFDDYWGDEPPFERVTFNADSESSGRANAVETGESDLSINITPADVNTIESADNARIEQVTSFRSIFLPMKNTIPPFDDQDFRRAMNYAVDNEEIVETVLSGFGEARGQPISPGINGFNDDIEPYGQDLDLAEDLARDAGHTEDDPADIELFVPEGRYLNDVQVGQEAADMIDQLPNVNCEANIVDFGVVSDANQAGVDPDEIEIAFYMIGWGVITGDADYGVQGFFTIPDNPNRTFDDEEISDAILDSQQIDDPDERREALEDTMELIHDKAPWVFLHTQESIYGITEDIPDEAFDPREDETIYVWEMG